MKRLLSQLRRRPVIAGSFLALLGLGAVIGQLATEGAAHAIPIPVLVYQIDAFSGTHHASLLNLPVGQPGVPQVPIPVDINGDLLPDVTVAVNLVNVNGIFSNPPNVGNIIAPNIQINRIPTANLLGQPSLPLKIYVTLTVLDSSGGPSTKVKFGYDTGVGGSIPENFTALVGGLNNFFNPIDAVIDTTGDNLGVNTGINGYGLNNVAAPYQGPLHVIAGVNLAGQQNADIDLGYRPFPKTVEVTYGTDSAGQHITYTHGVLSQVDLTTNVVLSQTVAGGQSVTSLSARVDRMPRSLKVDIGPMGGGSGSINWQTRSDGRPPDVGVQLSNTAPNVAPLNANLNVEGLPAVMHGEWTIGPNGIPGHAAFTASGQGIGAVEAYINNFAGSPTKLQPWVPNQQQFLNFQQVAGGPFGVPEQLISARVERIRSVTFDQTSDGYKADAQIGDGELPLQAHIGIDGRSLPGNQASPQIEATTTISPLPDHLAFQLHNPGTDQAVNPLKLDYTSSKSVDVDASLILRQPGTGLTDPCGAANTVCGNVAIRNIPSSTDFTQPSIEARVIGCPVDVNNHTTCPELSPTPTTPESRIEIDDVPGGGGTQPDITADVTIGPGLFDVPGTNAVPLVAHFQLQNFPKYVRIREVQGANKTLQRAEFHTCQYDYSAHACTGPEDEIGAVNFDLRDWTGTRPSIVPAPDTNAPMYATIGAGSPPGNTHQVLFEAAGQVVHIRELQYINTGGLFGVRARIGRNQDFLVDANLQKIAIPNQLVATNPPPIASLHARSLISPLPSTLNLCFRQAGEAVSAAPTDPVTAPCETNNPFGDGVVPSSPIAFAYNANTPFNVTVGLHATVDDGTPADLLDVAGSGKITNLPSNWAAFVMPPVGVVSPPSPYANAMRVLTTTTTPNPPGLNITLAGSLTRGGASCDDPHPTGHNLLCASASITNLTPNLSALIDSTKGAARYDFHTCNWQFFASTPGCQGSTVEQPISNITVSARAFNGNPRGVPILTPTRSPNQYVTVAADQLADNNYELRAAASINNIQHVTYDQAADGFDADAIIGGGKTLEVLGYLDTRLGVVPDPNGLHIEGSAFINPLPAHLTLSQHGTVTSSANPMTFTYDPHGQQMDIDAHGLVFLPTAYFRGSSPVTPACATPDTACANLDLDALPSKVVASLASVDDPVQATTPPTLARHLLFNLTNSGTTKPSLIADVAVGLPSDTPMVGNHPLFAHAEVIGFPQYVSAKMDQLVTNPGDTTKETQDLQRLEVHTCNYDYTNRVCAPGTEDQLDRLSINARDFEVTPAGFPSPTAGITDQDYASVVVRPDPTDPQQKAELFSLAAQLVQFKELQYVNNQSAGLKGFKVRIGDGKGFTAHADVAGFLLGDTSFGGMNLTQATINANVSAHVSNMPTSMAICMRSGGLPVPNPLPPASTDFTAPCEDNQAFANQQPTSPAPDHLPMSIAYIANSSIPEVTANADIALNGIQLVQLLPLPFPPIAVGPIATRHLHGDLDIKNIPATMVVHILTPSQDPTTGANVGPFRMLYTSSSALPQLSITVHGSLTQGDAVCEDPRPDRTAMCAGGTLSNLPTSASFFWNPDNVSNPNLAIHTTGDNAMNLTGLEFSTVKPQLDSSGNIIPGKATDIVATADVIGLPKDVTGTLLLPQGTDPPSIDLTASPPIQQIDATFRNFIAPNPFVDPVPTRTDTPAPDDEFIVRKFGDDVFASGKITNLSGVTFEPSRDATDGHALDTKLMKISFGSPGQTIRAYADINNGTSSVLGHIVADVVVTNIAQTLNVCFRGPKHIDGTPAVDNYCDHVPTADQGAFQFNDNRGAPGLLGVHAFLRASSSTGETLAGKVDVNNIPSVVQGVFGSGSVDVGGFEGNDSNFNGTNPDGIGSIGFELANADLATTPYNAPFPWGQSHGNGLAALPIPGASDQFAYLAAHDTNFHVRGGLGGTNGAQPQRIQVSPKPCLQPGAAGGPALSSPRGSFPFLPTNDGTTYTCARVTFAAVPGTPTPLHLYANVVEAGKQIVLDQAGISFIPQWLQLDLAQAAALDSSGKLRQPCGVLGSGIQGSVQQDASKDCMAPLIRFDVPPSTSGPSTTPALFGQLSLGTPSELADLANAQPRTGMLPDLNVSPGIDGSAWANPSGPSNIAWAQVDPDAGGPTGIRAKIGKFSNPEATAANVGVRIGIPASLTVDTPQSWSSASCPDSATNCNFSTPADKQANYYDESNLTIHYIARNADDTVKQKVGNIAAMIQDFTTGDQILVGDRNDDGSAISPGVSGGQLIIPGELGLDIYSRNQSGNGQKTYQIDGRVSTPISLHAELLGGSAASPIGKLDAAVLDIPAVDYSHDPDVPADVGGKAPSFRLRAELVGSGSAPPAPADTPPSNGDGAAPSPSGGSSCSILLCAIIDVRLAEAHAYFDFAPSGTPARRIDAVIHTNGAANALEAKGYASVDPSDNTTARFTADAGATIDPINIFFHVGIPIIGSFDFVLMMTADAEFDINNTNDFKLEQNIIHIDASTDGSPGAGISEINIGGFIYQLHGIAFSILGLFIGDPILLGVERPPGPIIFPWLPCPGTGSTGGVGNLAIGNPLNGLGAVLPPPNLPPLLPANPQDVVVNPLADPLLFFYGVLGPVFDGIKLTSELITPFACFLSTDLSTFTSDPNNPVPGDPIVNDANVPPQLPDVTNGPAAPIGPSAPTALHISNGQSVTLCGQHTYTSVSIDAGGTLNVGNYTDTAGTHNLGGHANDSPPPDCPLDQPLTLTAIDNMTIGGTINAASAANSGEIKLIASNITMNNGGIINGLQGTVSLIAAGDLGIDGQIHADGVQTSPTPIAGYIPISPFPSFNAPSASGNSGGGHGGAGGDGSSPSGGGTYGNSGFTGQNFPPYNGDVPQENGAAGVGGPGPGAGGGQISLQGATIEINSHAHVTADGAGGASTNNDGSQCYAPTPTFSGSVTSGSTALVAGSGTFTSGDVGATVTQTGGAGAIPGGVTIASVTDSAHAALSANATTTGGISFTLSDRAARANTGSPASGGGAGGSILLSAERVQQDNHAKALEAVGGGGGAGNGGGGGGGGGGIIKVSSSVLSGYTPVVSGGGAGPSACTTAGHDPGPGHAGNTGATPQQIAPSTRADVPTDSTGAPIFWNQTTTNVPFTVANQSGPIDVVLCGMRRPPEAALSIYSSKPALPYDFVMPTHQNAFSIFGFNVCGLHDDGSAVSVLASTHIDDSSFPSSRVIHGTFDGVSLPQDGYWALYTVWMQQTGSSDSCYTSGLFAPSNCNFEVYTPSPGQKTSPDAVIGVDGANPSVDLPAVSVAGPTSPVNTSTVNLTINATDAMNTDSSGGQIYDCSQNPSACTPVSGQTVPSQLPVSGIKFIQCSNDGVTWVTCQSGTNPWNVGPGDGDHTVSVRAIDNAGNVTNPVATHHIIVFTQPPTSSGHLLIGGVEHQPSGSGPDGQNGWYVHDPTFTLDNFTAETGDKPATNEYDYEFVDNGVFNDAVLNGTTTLTSASAAFGNSDVGITISGSGIPSGTTITAVTDSQTATLSNAATTSATNVTIHLGRDSTISSCQDPCNIDSTAKGLPGDGIFAFKWRARDEVNNVSAWQEIDYMADSRAPISTVSTIPAQPQFNGSPPFFTTNPFVVVSTVDTPGGSGMAAPTPNITYSLAPDRSGTTFTYSGPILLGDGFDHEVCWVARDIAGNADGPHCSSDPTPTGEGAAGQWNVDTTPPTATATVDGVAAPGVPDGNNGWFRHVPNVVISGYSDATSGPPADATQEIRYRVDNSATNTCASPCTVDPSLLQTGAHTVLWSAVDKVGNATQEVAIPLKVDILAPSTQVNLFPASPDGSNSWYVTSPWVVMTPTDQPAILDGDNPLLAARNFDHLLPFGSGVDHTTVRIDLNPTFNYSGPFQIPNGVHQLCWQSVDVAGNAENGGSGNLTNGGPTPVCEQIKVDLDNPTANVVDAPTSPTGHNGWYNVTPNPAVVSPNAVVASVVSADATSGLVPPGGANAPLCGDQTLPDPAPAGTCISIDGAPFVPYTGQVGITEGLHSVATYSVDQAGRHSSITMHGYQVDLSPPLPVLRTVPGAPAAPPTVVPNATANGPFGWFRTSPLVVLRSVDGDQNSGPVTIKYLVTNDSAPPAAPTAAPAQSGAGWTTYSTPFYVPEGFHTVYWYATDSSGLASVTLSQSFEVDLTPPVAIATAPSPALWLQLLSILGNILGLSPAQAKLQWTLSDNMSPHVHVWVIVYNVTGQAVRYLDGGVQNTTPGQTLNGFTYWDGHDQTLTGLVPVGLYYYRVVAEDDAGNFTQSGQSIPIQIKASLGL